MVSNILRPYGLCAASVISSQYVEIGYGKQGFAAARLIRFAGKHRMVNGSSKFNPDECKTSRINTHAYRDTLKVLHRPSWREVIYQVKINDMGLL